MLNLDHSDFYPEKYYQKINTLVVSLNNTEKHYHKKNSLSFFVGASYQYIISKEFYANDNKIAYPFFNYLTANYAALNGGIELAFITKAPSKILPYFSIDADCYYVTDSIMYYNKAIRLFANARLGFYI